MEHEGGGDTNYNWCTWSGPQRLGKLEIGERAETTRLLKIGQKIEKSQGDLR